MPTVHVFECSFRLSTNFSELTIIYLRSENKILRSHLTPIRGLFSKGAYIGGAYLQDFTVYTFNAHNSRFMAGRNFRHAVLGGVFRRIPSRGVDKPIKP